MEKGWKGWKEAQRAGNFPVEVYLPLESIRWGLSMGMEGAVTNRMGFLWETEGKPCSGMAKSTGVMREIDWSSCCTDWGSPDLDEWPVLGPTILLMKSFTPLSAERLVLKIWPWNKRYPGLFGDGSGRRHLAITSGHSSSSGHSSAAWDTQKVVFIIINFRMSILPLEKPVSLY